jgi:hypothetical protein
MTLKTYIILIALALSCFSQSAIAQGNLVVDGGFDTSPDGWTFNKWVGLSLGGNPGNFALLYNSSLSDPTLPTASQTISGLIPSDSYIVSGDYELWKNSGGSSSVPSFGVAIDDIFLFETAAPTTPLIWQSFNFTYTATSSSAILSISAQLNGIETSYGIDNIAMYAAPEPSPSLLIIFGSGVFIYARRTRVSVSETSQFTGGLWQTKTDSFKFFTPEMAGHFETFSVRRV